MASSSSFRAGAAILWTDSPAADVTATVTGSQHSYNSAVGDSDSILSNDQFLIANTVVDCGIFPALSLLGLPANLLNMVVFYRQGLRDKMNLCLFALAFVDFMFVLGMLLSSVYCPLVLFSDDVPLAMVVKFSAGIYSAGFRNAFIHSSGLLTVIIATERCICVVWPLKSASLFKTKAMAWTIFGVVVVFNLLSLPFPLAATFRWSINESGNVTVIFYDTDLYINNRFAFDVFIDVILPAISFITFFVVSVVTVVTVRKLKTAMDWRQKTSSTVMDKRQITLVKMLITVVCVYIACSFPRIVLSIAKILFDDFSTIGKFRNLCFFTHDLALALLMINSSVNFFIYMRQSSKFREELCSWFCCFRNKMDNN